MFDVVVFEVDTNCGPLSVFIDSGSPGVTNIASRQLIILPDVTDLVTATSKNRLK